MTSPIDESQSYKNGEWLPFSKLGWSVTDFGTSQGALLVERLRTFGGRLVAVDDYVARLAEGAVQLGIPWPPRSVDVVALCGELVDRNRSLCEKLGDVGLVILLSPGDPGIDRRCELVPTLMAHIAPLPFAQLARWYRLGAALRISSTRNVPMECWSPSIKTRSRLQYFLADRRHSDGEHATSQAMDGTNRPPDSIAVLLGIRGCVTETSISNLLILGNDGILKSPPLSDILWGMSLKTVCELAESINQPLKFIEIHPNELSEAKEILMTGSTGCLWAAVSVEGNLIGDGRPGRLCKRLQEAWQQNIGFNFVEQAMQRQ